jgi:type II secretory pathway pseudopilin PulG
MYYSRFRREAFTLVEVIASLLLLSTLLVATLVAHGRHARQIRAAKEQLAAVAAAEELLSEWNSSGQTGAPAREGKISGPLQLGWRWEVIETPELRPMGAAIGRLQIVSAAGKSLTTIDVVTSGSFALPPEKSRWY